MPSIFLLLLLLFFTAPEFPRRRLSQEQFIHRSPSSFFDIGAPLFFLNRSFPADISFLSPESTLVTLEIVPFFFPFAMVQSPLANMRSVLESFLFPSPTVFFDNLSRPVRCCPQTSYNIFFSSHLPILIDHSGWRFAFEKAIIMYLCPLFASYRFFPSPVHAGLAGDRSVICPLLLKNRFVEPAVVKRQCPGGLSPRRSPPLALAVLPLLSRFVRCLSGSMLWKNQALAF